ncbi:MAG: hypothetical protein ABNG97_05405 [Sulfitobacter sp.]
MNDQTPLEIRNRDPLGAPFVHVETIDVPTPRRRFVSPFLVVALCLYTLAGVGAAATVDALSEGRLSAPRLVAAGALWPVFIGAAAVRAGHLQ